MGKNQDDFFKINLAAHSESAFTSFYNLYWDALFKYVIRILPDEDETGDVIQEAFLILWQNRDRLNEIRSLKAYLFVVARNLAFKNLKSHLHRKDFAEKLADYYQDSDDLTIQQIEANELTQIIEKVIVKMPEKMKDIFVMSRKEDLSHKEIAERLHISDLTVKKQVCNALKLIRMQLKKDYDNIFLISLIINYI